MNDVFQHYLAQARDWFKRGHQAGFLDGGDLKRLAEVESRTPDDLFAARASRAGGIFL